MAGKDSRDVLKTLLATSALGAMIAAAPVTIDVDTDYGVIAIKPSVAFADDDDSDNDRDDNDRDDDHDDDDDDDDDDEDDDEDDDDEDDEDEEDEDEDEEDEDDQFEAEYTLSDGTEIEVSDEGIEVKYSDGWEEELENGRYEMTDPAGNTVVERPERPGDRERLEALIP